MSDIRRSTERFSNRVENYVKYRPGYPNEFIDFLYTNVGFSKEAFIADIGSGTGKLTGLLLERGSYVVGVEPNKEMREAAEKLLSEYPKFVSSSGTAEHTGLNDGAVDFIICATAFHWFDRDPCKKEFARILKHKGKVILVWNRRIVNADDFSSEYEKLLSTYVKEYDSANHGLITDNEFGSFFEDGVYTEFAFNNEQSFDFEGLKGRMLSSSYTPIQGEPNHDVLMKGLKKLFDLFNIDGKVTFKYNTGGYFGEVQP